MTPDRLEQIRAGAEAATPGPWWHGSPTLGGRTTIRGGPDEWRGFDGSLGGDTRPVARVDEAPDGEGGFVTNHAEDAEFIAHARTDVPDLLAEVERLTAELARVGICGDRLPGLVNYEPSSVCDLPAGHAGWCGADNPPNATGVQSRVSWTRDAQGLLGVVVATEGAQP